ncbi:MAG: hypothetical protein O7G29_12995 [Acidobacteria bacterium]|nr:hypothetical protein [Acidobacteriota bacterium]
MPSSTFSSDQGNYERPLPSTSLKAAGWMALLVCLLSLTGWELYWRDLGVTSSYRNSDGLWAIQRRRIDRGEGDKTVIVASSRGFFNFQLDVWERESGSRPIQLGLEGTSPVLFMEDLADDPDFIGTLLVGVSPGPFFRGDYREEVLQRYDEESPSQWLGQRISMLIEPHLAFYSFDFALFTVLKRQAWPDREGVVTNMEVRKLANFTKERHARLFSKVETDEEYRELAREIWADGFVPLSERDEDWIETQLEEREKRLDRAVAATRKLQDKGVEVIFFRCPAEGHYSISEPMYFPRDKTWDVLIERTGVLGLHFQDHPEMQGYWLPEWSHMSGSEAERFTASLYHLIQRERARLQEQEQE